MTVPGRITLLTAAFLALPLIAAVVEPLIAPVALLADVLLVGACLLEGRRLSRLAVEVSRENPGRIQVGQPQVFAYRVDNRSKHSLFVRLRQPWPKGMQAEANVAEVRIAGGEVVRMALQATPGLRGSAILPPAEIDVRFSIDLARWRFAATGESTIQVLPSLRGMSEFEALRRHHASSYAGLHRQRMLGAGREFDQLRDYFPDDDFRDVNWKATARRSHPISNMYQAERSQDLMLCLDCGRMMGNPVGGGTALDHAIDASIMLAHVANRQGDRTGLALFRDVVYRFVKPASGMKAVHQVIEELVDAQPQPVFPSYAALVAALRARQNRRSMIFLFTDLNDPQLAANLAEVLPLAARRHVLVVISLRDPLLDKVAAGPAAGRTGVYQVLAARHLDNERATCTRELHRIGATVLEADAGSLTLEVLNSYLSIKARQIL